MHIFVERYDGSPLILGEGQAMAWFLPCETHDLLMNDHDRLIIDAVERSAADIRNGRVF
jgi:hypothetical protein